MKKLIKTKDEYTAALSRLHLLLDKDPAATSDVANEIELLALLIATFESENFETLPAPTPVEAIRFRMEQLGLGQKDLVKYIGSASRVSEILSGRRALTLPMIRALHEHLGIPAELLITNAVDNEEVGSRLTELNPKDFPISEMVKRGWMEAASSHHELLMRLTDFVRPVLPFAAAFKRTLHFRGTRNIDVYAITAWLARVWQRAEEQVTTKYEAGTITEITMREVARLSCLDRGPVIAIEYLAKVGVRVVIEPALPRTFLDGATLFTPVGPIVGLTLRFDRLDNYWFVLLHELAHVALHTNISTVFLDDLEAGATDDAENEADTLALEATIPLDAWRRSPASRVRSRQAAETLAQELRISPAIVAGRIRRQYNDYKVLNNVVGHRAVRQLFPEISWDDSHGS